MRGRPLLNVILFALVWGLLGLPLWRLTHASAPDGARGAPVAAGHARAVVRDEHAWATLRFSPLPESFRVSQDGRTLWEGTNVVGLTQERECRLSMTAGRVAVLLDVDWPAGVEQGAAELTVEPDRRPAASRQAWGSGRSRHNLEFSWKP